MIVDANTMQSCKACSSEEVSSIESPSQNSEQSHASPTGLTLEFGEVDIESLPCNASCSLNDSMACRGKRTHVVEQSDIPIEPQEDATAEQPHIEPSDEQEHDRMHNTKRLKTCAQERSCTAFQSNVSMGESNPHTAGKLSRQPPIKKKLKSQESLGRW